MTFCHGYTIGTIINVYIILITKNILKISFLVAIANITKHHTVLEVNNE